MLYRVVLTFKSVDKALTIENCGAVLFFFPGKRLEKYAKLFFALVLFRGNELITFFFNLSETTKCSVSNFFLFSI